MKDNKKIKAAEKLRQLLNENWNGGNVKISYKENMKEIRWHPHRVKKNVFKEFLRLFRLVLFRRGSAQKEQ